MRRPELAVTVPSDEQQWSQQQYHLTQSPSTIQDARSSISESIKKDDLSNIDLSNSQPAEYSPPKPSIRILYTFCTRRDTILLILPAAIISVLAGGMAPFMTQVVGQAFDAFSKFPISNASQEAKHTLIRGVGFAALELVGLAAGQLAFSSLQSSLWIWVGERNVMRLRKQVYDVVSTKSMTWYDLKLGGDEETVPEKLGAGGLMAKFSKETDDVRTASALTAGMIIQHLVTFITCMILAFARSWALTLVILSTVPLVVVVQAIAQRYGMPLYGRECAGTAKAGSLLERAVSNISTVKAFNAIPRETLAFNRASDIVRRFADSSGAVWATSLAFTQFQSMTLFVQAFGFGAKLVRDGKLSPGDVMTVFWACLIAATSLQAAMPFFQTFSKGKIAMVSLIAFIEEPLTTTITSDSSSKVAVMSAGTTIRLHGIRPAKCHGEFNFRNVSFAYPSRPDTFVLKDVTLYLPAHETTFIVGGSGSGKSTIAQLLLRMYEPQHGDIEFDNQGFTHIDSEWLQAHILSVNQSTVLFDMSVHDNVAMGTGATRSQVIDACRVALMHEFIRDLPDGYDTALGTSGASLSGGQRQRLAIARAWIRNPDVLILDEATSALDVMSRLLVYEAIKAWRKNKTTIVITHDLSQIAASDFVYFLKEGSVVEQGYRGDLEANPAGDFSMMARTQIADGFPEKKIDVADEIELDNLLDAESIRGGTPEALLSNRHQSVGLSLRPTAAWMFDAVRDLSRSRESPQPDYPSSPRRRKVSDSSFEPALQLRRHSTIDSPISIPSRTLQFNHRHSYQSPILPSVSSSLDLFYTHRSSHSSSTLNVIEDDMEFEVEKQAVHSSGLEAVKRRHNRNRSQTLDAKMRSATVEATQGIKIDVDPKEAPASVIKVLRRIYPTIPNKPLLFVGLLTCAISGAMTPIFSFLLAQLYFQVSSGAKSESTVVKYAFITLAVAAADGIFAGVKSILMELAAVRWMTKIRKEAYARVLAQDKAWFDEPANSPARLVNILAKDADDAKRLLSICLSMFVVVTTMLMLGLIWALVWGWQLTLVGLAIAPIFAGTISLQARLTSKFQLKSKRAREEVSKIYYEMILNIRSIRSMSIQSVFTRQYDAALSKALLTGVKGAFIEGSAFGVTNAMIYLSEGIGLSSFKVYSMISPEKIALLFIVGALLVAKGTFTYLQMVQVLDLLIFSVSIAAQMMVFLDRIAKSSQAAQDLMNVWVLGTDTQESKGSTCPTITGRVSFDNVSFVYPQRPDVPVLKNVSFQLKEGESVAIVGSSGSGKSTIAHLLQRLYEPSEGSISVGRTTLRDTEVSWLREHVSVVSQNPHLFDASIYENIAYGASEFPLSQVRRAAKAANVHKFIMELPKDYNTSVGENASLISGGQAQRIQIARALVRPCNILILDECTSSLDLANQAAVMETIQRVKAGRTTVVITHKLEMMKMCDRILVLHDGSITEQGSFDFLMGKRGEFFRLATAGEWSESR